MASQITGISTVCSTACLDEQQLKTKVPIIGEGNPMVSTGFPLKGASNRGSKFLVKKKKI